VRCYGFIYNPRSGDGHRLALLHESEERLRAAGFEVREYLCEGDPAVSARAALHQGCDVLVACGGDGTVNAVASVAFGSEAVLAVLPIGTLNHFAKDMGIHSVSEARQVLAAGVARPVDAGFVNGHIFVNNSGVGIYPAAVREREKVQKSGIPKWTAFLFASLKTAVRMPFMRLRIDADGRRMARSTSFLFVGNNVYQLEGTSLGTRASLQAGVLGVCTARDAGVAGLFRIAVRAVLGTLRQDRDFLAFTAKKLTVHRGRHFHVSLDGEVIRMKSPLEYSVAPGALRVLGPS
jgi:diacylglycerol kinase family enzyme